VEESFVFKTNIRVSLKLKLLVLSIARVSEVQIYKSKIVENEEEQEKSGNYAASGYILLVGVLEGTTVGRLGFVSNIEKCNIPII
jgi:hypothetical protein